MNKLLNIAQAGHRQFVREYAFKSDLKIKWVRPEKIACYKPEKSGDLAKLPPLKADELLPEYRDCKELDKYVAVFSQYNSLFTSSHHFVEPTSQLNPCSN